MTGLRFQGIYVTQIALSQKEDHAQHWPTPPKMEKSDGNWEIQLNQPKGKAWREPFEPVVNFKEGGSWIILRNTGKDYDELSRNMISLGSPWGIHISQGGGRISRFFSSGDGKSFKTVGIGSEKQVKAILSMLNKATFRDQKDEEMKFQFISLAQRLLQKVHGMIDGPRIRTMLDKGEIQETPVHNKALLKEAKAVFKQKLEWAIQDKHRLEDVQGSTRWPETVGGELTVSEDRGWY